MSEILSGYNWATGVYKNANSAWESLYVGLNYEGDECSPRNLKIKETLGCDITILNPIDNLVYNSFRGLSPRYAALEWIWYNDDCTLDIKDAGNLSKFWLTLDNGDGTINSNYGYHIFKSKEYGNPNWNLPQSQWSNTRDILKSDPDSRKAIIQFPIVGTRFSKDTICTSSLQFFIRNDKLHLIVYMRSNDICKGFPYDVFQFTMLQLKMAKELGIEVGNYRHICGSLHCYEPDFIENVNDKFTFSEEEFDISNRCYDSLVGDIYKLKNKEYDTISDDMIKVMLTRKKIWK